jgi:hypothetical protein
MVSNTVHVMSRLGSAFIDITTISGIVIARHHRAPDGAGAVIRDNVHVTALDHAAMNAATSAAPHRRKQRIPPGPTALAAAAALTGTTDGATGTVADLAAYARAAQGRNTLT